MTVIEDSEIEESDSRKQKMSIVVHGLFLFFFFFSSRRRHTRLQGDWSSDVCSSDLRSAADGSDRGAWPRAAAPCRRSAPRERCSRSARAPAASPGAPPARLPREIGRASCRERV